ncbi:MAG TPA: cell division protein ZapA [Candidatus Phocaeicola excrementigallinarum]|nr:cell division protein ZapA [Candidatus Phocaeicola excrementigallinarum]
MDDKFKIRLKIDNEEYPLTILRKDEEDYRKAAKLIDYKLNKYRITFPKLDAGKHWLMVAVELAYENVLLEKKNDTRPYFEKLSEMEEALDRCFEEETDEKV